MIDLIPKSEIEIPAEMHTSVMPKLNLQSIAFWLSTMVLFSTVTMAVFRPSSSQWDFVVYYDAGLSVRLHSNPYNFQGLERFGLPHSSMSFTYLPLIAYSFVPLTYFSVAAACRLWILLKCIALLFLWRLVSTDFVPLSLGNGWDLAFCVFAYNSTLLFDLVAGNLTIFVMVALWLGFAAYSKAHVWRFTFWIVLSSLVKFHPIAFLLLLPVQLGVFRSLRYLLAGFGSLGAFILFNYRFFPGLFAGFLRNSTFQLTETGVLNPSALSFFRSALMQLNSMSSINTLGLQLNMTLAYFLYFCFLALIITLCWRHFWDQRKLTEPQVAVLFFSMIYALLIPRLKNYEFIIAIPATLYVLRRQDPRWVPLLGFLFCIPYAHPTTVFPEMFTASALVPPLKRMFYLAFEYSPWLTALVGWWLFLRLFGGRPAPERSNPGL